MTKIAHIINNHAKSGFRYFKLKQQWCSDDFNTSVVIIKLMHSHLLLLITVFLKKSQLLVALHKS